MAPRGYAAASINYRLTGVAKWPAQIYDCKAAVRWLRAHAKDYNLDPDHFGVWGESAGGHLVAMLGTSGGVKELEGDLGNPGVSSRVQAVCDWYGPTDLPVLDQEKSAIAWDKPDSFTSKLLGGPIREHLDAARQASPVTWVTKDAPPFLIMHGDKDPLVPFQQGEILDEALRKAGDQSRFILVPRAGHNLHNPESLKTVCDFFDEHLKKEN
jgi:acetyl esterase/lipase